MKISEVLAEECNFFDDLIGCRASEWDEQARIPTEVVRRAAESGLLCPQVPVAVGGRGFDSLHTGELAAHVGSRCSSLRSVMTSQGMAAWAIQRLGNKNQRNVFLPQLSGGKVAAVGFTEPNAGSNLSGISTSISCDGDVATVNGHKKWVTGSVYADFIVVFGRIGDGAAAIIVPTSAPGVRLEAITDGLGCRAAGHADIYLNDVRLPAENILGREPQSLPLITTIALQYGRISVAWGCVGILRACLDQAAGHARARRQSEKALVEHQLIKRYLAEIFVLEQTAAHLCEEASRAWDSAMPDLAMKVVLAKHVSSQNATKGAAMAVQILASAGAHSGDLVARAYRDSKLMEIIEGSTEISQLILSDYVMSLY
ncbi:Glutaryl-CoA dehydrogenase [Mycobacterium basiliense]|uniref:Glutaryl-CoA dehydrogenase n=1 Tax=Mycobacterium basiliense TaxID=2094119 RepID=A0A3S4BGA8_9MYCO|nr:acyl-CoA dehydrogenase family protein [Mycobacterium basiliense]VDM89180.1 Glutaryl-CoA dehydrogenase [Mycobacterium basiliense]